VYVISQVCVIVVTPGTGIILVVVGLGVTTHNLKEIFLQKEEFPTKGLLPTISIK
jgi:hypothetical protein